MSHEEFKTMAQVSAELASISRSLAERDKVDAERRKVDDARDARMLDRVDKHGTRMTEMETKWTAFFGETGAFKYLVGKIKSTDIQNRWIIGLIVTTLIAVIVNLATKH